MADILEHPDKDMLTKGKTFEYGDGFVTVQCKRGEPLTVQRANFLLDLAKHELMRMFWGDVHD